jgi:thiol-disulfide isomerase/thioredoxin
MMDRKFAVAAWVAFSFSTTLLVGCGDSDSGQSGTDSSAPSVTADDSDSSGSQADGTEPETEPAEWENAQQPAIGTKPKEKSADWEISLRSTDKAGYDTVLKESVGRVVLVDFWGSWCAECMKGFPHTVDLSRKYRKQGLRVVSYSIEFDEENGAKQALDFLKKSDASLIENLTSSKDYEATFDAFELTSLPEYRIYDGEGNLVKTFNNDDNLEDGPTFTHHDIEAAIREALGLPAEEDGAEKKEGDTKKADAKKGAE